MSKLPVVTGQRLIKALHKIGFEVIRRKVATISFSTLMAEVR